MDPEQTVEMQQALENVCFEVSEIQKRMRHEDVRKRIFRTLVIICLMIIIALQIADYFG